MKLRLMPIPSTHTLGKRARSALQMYSCFGDPNPTYTRSGLAASHGVDSNQVEPSVDLRDRIGGRTSTRRRRTVHRIRVRTVGHETAVLCDRGAALVTAVVLYLTAGDDSERAALEVTPVLGGDVWGATLAGRF